MRALALSALLLAGGCAAPPQEPVSNLVEPPGVTMGTWRPVDAAIGGLTDIASLEQLVSQFPDSGSVNARLLSAYVAAGKGGEAFRLVDRMTERGYRFSPAGEARLREFFAEQQYSKMFILTMRPDEVIESSRIAAEVPATVQLVEAALKERRSGRIYATSIVSRGLIRQDGKGGWERVELGETGSLGGILQAIDGTIWVSSAVYEQTPEPATAFRGLLGYDPGTGEVRRIAAPGRATPSDVAIAPDGTLFAADPLTGAIYRARRSADALELFVPTGTFRSAQGMAVSGDGRFLYVSDYGYGLALVDLETGAVDRLPAPAAPFVDGTDGLWLYGRDLIAIQNGARPMRIVAHRLAPDGRSIVSTRILESAAPIWTEPGAGSISGDELLYVATGQWERFGEGGAPVEGRPPLPTQLRALQLAD